MKKLSILAITVLGLLIVALSASAVSVTVFDANFDNGVPPEFTGITTTESVQGYAGYGFGGNFLRNAHVPETKTTLTLTGLAPHTSVDLGFLLATIDSWDGVGCHAGPNGFDVTVDGQEIFSEVFENSTCGAQTYAGAALARRADLGFNTDPTYYGDSAYNMGLDSRFQNIPHTSSTLTIDWFTSGGAWEGGTDESWAIDNVQVILNDVFYNFAGFFNPVDGEGNINEVKAGRNIPIKFSLNGYQGMDIFHLDFPSSIEVGAACGGGEIIPESETLTPGNSSLSYDADTDTYHYNWKTEKDWAGTCRQLSIQLNDGSMHMALFNFR